ncbi:MAG: hypothetical protein IPH66_16675 [Crocinitomicaceae bacterium]|nr:hypothetical protein [Crocinitomicaceae bacterium]
MVFICGIAIQGRSQEISALRQKVYALNEMVQDPERQVGNFNPDSMPSLPIGIAKEVGQTLVIIAIDSAYFLSDGAYFSAYMALDFPNADVPLAFAAKDIKFNPKGIIGGEQSKLMLVSEHLIDVGPNTKLLLPDDGSNYVRWSCNGFESVNLHGYFLFEDGMLSPAEGSGDTVVTAEFEVNVTDVHNMMAMVDFSPFVVKGMEDFSFTVSSAYVDMSDYVNPMNVNMPACYHENYPDDINLWRGFYLQYFSVQLPEELNRSDQPVDIFASDLFIDDAGVTGTFGATNVFSTSENAMNDEWSFSLDSIAIGLTLNKITKGRMRGTVVVPPLDNTQMIFTAMVSQNDNNRQTDMYFSMKPASTVSISCFNSNLDLYSSSQFEVQRINHSFKPRLRLNGLWSLDNTNWNFQGIGFEQFTIITEAPYVTNGLFTLVTSGTQAKAGNFPISFDNIQFGISNGDIVLGADIALNFADTSNENNFSATTGVQIYSDISRNPSTNKIQWQYDHFNLNSIELDVNTTVVSLDGIINFHDNDPVYGKGFYGGLEFMINSVMETPLSMACAFGRVNGFRYWMVDATLPTTIPVGAITITSITGGIAYHMQNTQNQNDLISQISTTNSSGNSLSPHYVPDESTGLFFKAGAGFKHTLNESTLNGDVLFSIAFNSSGGLQYINFSGDAYTMCKIEERHNSSNYGHGQVYINYDNQQKILDAQIAVTAQFSGAITANIWSQFYFSPGLWFVTLGKPSMQCTVNVLNLATVNAYFMFGQNLEPMPPPPPQIANVFSSVTSQRSSSHIASGNGLACGMSIGASFNKSFSITDNISVYAAGWATMGFDMTMYKYASTTHCEGSSEPFGMNYWYLQGQLYAGMGINLGATYGNQDMTIISGNVAALLQAKMPKPSYVFGGIHVDASLFGIFNLDFDAQFEFGENCVVVG